MVKLRLLEKMPARTMYNRLKSIKTKTGNSISTAIALDVLGSLNDIDVYGMLR